MRVGDAYSSIAFYGCFLKNETTEIVSGTFAADETYLEVRVRGDPMLVSVSEQECETAPSVSPTNFPTISPAPTVPRSGSAKRNCNVAIGFAIAAATFIQMMAVSVQ